jgi:hypothetical protein
LALRDAIHGGRIGDIRENMTPAEQVLNKLMKKNEGSEIYKYYYRKLIEMINLTNHMKGCPIQISEDTDAELISSFLLSPTPDQITNRFLSQRCSRCR